MLKSLVFVFVWVFILACLVRLIAEARFAIKSRCKDRFQWLVPEYAHGQETEFEVPLEKIERAEFNTIYRRGDDTR